MLLPALRRMLVALWLAGCVLLGAPALVSASPLLPDGRAWELVSPPAEGPLAPFAAVPANDGTAVDFQARGAFAGAGSGSLNLYQARRGGGGWQTAPLTPAPPSPLGPLEEQVPLFFSPDLSQTIFTTPASYAPGDEDGGALDLYLRSSDGTMSWLSTGPQGGAAPDEVTFDSATPDASKVVFSTAEQLLPAAGALEAGDVPESEYLYQRTPASAQTQLLDVDEHGSVLGSAETVLTAPAPEKTAALSVASTEGFRAGEQVTLGAGPHAQQVRIRTVEGPTSLLLDSSLAEAHEAAEPVSGLPAGAILGDGTELTTGAPPVSQYLPADLTGTTTHAVSSDGSRVFFESPSPETHQTVSLYMREGDSRTVLIARSRSTFPPPEPSEQVRFEGAGETGSLVFYTSAHALYDYDTETSSTTTIAPSVLGASAISNDGSRVYFVSESVLAGNENPLGASAVEGAPNLYVDDTSDASTSFIGTLAQRDVVAAGYGPGPLIAEPDIGRPAVPTPDGDVLAFASYGNLTGQNPSESYSEIYRYSVSEDSLVCVSCTPPGREPTGNASFGETAGGTYDPPGASSPIDASGSEVFFQTPDSLLGEDTNQGAPADPLTGEPGSTDVYEWEGGGVHLISCACSSVPATLMGTTPSGDDVLFTTATTLIPSESAGGYTALYDARVGGGFPPPPSDTGPSCPSGCRAGSSEPPLLATPPTATFQGPGNPPAPKPKPKPKPLVCKKGYVKRTLKLPHHRTRTVCVKRKPARTSTRHRVKPR